MDSKKLVQTQVLNDKTRSIDYLSESQVVWEIQEEKEEPLMWHQDGDWMINWHDWYDGFVKYGDYCTRTDLFSGHSSPTGEAKLGNCVTGLRYSSCPRWSFRLRFTPNCLTCLNDLRDLFLTLIWLFCLPWGRNIFVMLILSGAATAI